VPPGRRPGLSAERREDDAAAARPAARATDEAATCRADHRDGDGTREQQPFALREKSRRPAPAGRLRRLPALPGRRPRSPTGPACCGTRPRATCRSPHRLVTFSQPMVAVTSHAEPRRRASGPPAPEPPGQWRWVGTKTLASTSHGHRLPGGGAGGNAVGHGGRWLAGVSILDAALTVVASHPAGGLRGATLMFASTSGSDPGGTQRRYARRLIACAWPRPTRSRRTRR
jgi:hypothetical protein